MFNILNNLELITTFVKVCETGTLKEAASALHVSQATVSLRLKKLQSFFSPALFSKQGRKLQVTDNGKELYVIASQNLNSLNADLGAINHSERLASRSPIKMGARLEIFYKLHSKFDLDIPLNLIHHTSRSALKEVQEGKLDCAITHVQTDSADLIYIPLFVDRFFFVAPKKIFRRTDHLNAALVKKLLENHQVLSYDDKGAIVGKWLAQFGLALDSVKKYVACDN